MTLAIALVSNEHQTTLIATWPRFDALAGWLMLALGLVVIAVSVDVALGLVVGTIALPIALGALGWAASLLVEEVRR